MIEFDSNSGAIKLSNGLEIGQHLSRSQFIASSQGEKSQAIIKNNPWYSYELPIYEGNISITLSSKNDLLTNIYISVCSKEFGTTWSDWSEKNEERRKVANEQWLRKNHIEPNTTYPWGKVSSLFDQKSGESFIITELN